MKNAVLTIDIAGVALGFTIRNRALFGLIRRRYHGYLCREPAAIQFACTFSTSRLFSRRINATVLRDVQGIWHAMRRDFDCRWTGSRGTLNLRPSVYSFDACLRVLLATVLPLHGCVLIHAASVAVNRAGFVFAGVSGSGKTTISRLSKTGRVLNDEISALRLTDRGIVVAATPFWGEMGTGPACRRQFPLQGLYFLEKGLAHNIIPLPVQNALQPLLRCLCVFSNNPDDQGRMLDLAIQIVGAHCCATLVFAKDPSVWTYLRDEHAGKRAAH
jgi:hypothetical protein